MKAGSLTPNETRQPTPGERFGCNREPSARPDLRFTLACIEPTTV